MASLGLRKNTDADNFHHSRITLLVFSLIHSVVFLMTGPQSLPKRVLHTVRSGVSSLNFQCPLLSLRSSSSCIRLLLCLHVAFICPSIFPSIMHFKRQSLSNMRTIHFAFLRFITCKIFLVSSSTPQNSVRSNVPTSHSGNALPRLFCLLTLLESPYPRSCTNVYQQESQTQETGQTVQSLHINYACYRKFTQRRAPTEM